MGFNTLEIGRDGVITLLKVMEFHGNFHYTGVRRAGKCCFNYCPDGSFGRLMTKGRMLVEREEIKVLMMS